jgi:hypothetical protein
MRVALEEDLDPAIEDPIEVDVAGRVAPGRFGANEGRGENEQCGDSEGHAADSHWALLPASNADRRTLMPGNERF